MIQSLKIKNFLSFKDEVEISFDASKDKDLEDYHVVEVAPGVRLLKFLVVYGYNASGKSNLIKAFEFLRRFVFEQRKNKDDNIPFLPFMLDNSSSNLPSSFKLTFFIGSKKYVYELVFNRKEVLEENLFHYPGTQPAAIFKRVTTKGASFISFPDKLKVSVVEKKEILLKCLPNTSVFAAYNQVNTIINDFEKVSNWFKTIFMQVIMPTTNLEDFAEDMIIKDQACKQKVLDYLHRADFNIVNVKNKITESEVSDDMLDKIKGLDIPKEEINRIEKTGKIDLSRTEFFHNVNEEGENKEYPLLKNLQSEGTLRIFGLSAAVYKAIEQNAFLAIDEIESKLHPHLIEYLIEEFLKESKQSQLLVATHYDNLFDQDDLLRKDNFWFTEKKENGSTDLYALKDFTGLNRISSLQKAYKFGKFGATPDLD
ncbi:MAG: ATP-binding protein [Bacteroidales bacterium]